MHVRVRSYHFDPICIAFDCISIQKVLPIIIHKYKAG